MSQQTVISIARLSAVNDRMLLLRSQLQAAFCEHALRLEMTVYITLTSLLKEFVKPWAEAQEQIIVEKDNNNHSSDKNNESDNTHCTHTLSRVESTTELIEARLIVTNYLQDILAALLYLMPTNELVQVAFDNNNSNNNNNTSASTVCTANSTHPFDIRCYPVPPLMSVNQSAFYVSNAQRRHCAEVFFYLCYSSLLPRHHVIAALYPLQDTFTISTIKTTVETTTTTQALPKEQVKLEENAESNKKSEDTKQINITPQTSTLQNSVAPNMLSDKRFVHSREFVKYVLTGLLLSSGNGVRTLCRVFILDDRIEHGAIVEASQQVIRLLTNFNESYVWLAICENNDENVSNEYSDTMCCKVQMVRVTQEMFMKCICKELVDLFTECAPLSDVSSVIVHQRTPSFLQNMHHSTLPAETLEERLHIFLALLANEMVELPRKDATQVKSCANYQHAYRRFYYFNKYFLTPSFAILSLRIKCSTKSENISKSNVIGSQKTETDNKNCYECAKSANVNELNVAGINESCHIDNSDDVTESIVLSLRRLYCLLHATECGVGAKVLLLVLESIMPGLLMLSTLINNKNRFVPAKIKVQLFERIWAKLLSTEFDAYAEQFAEIMVNACFTCSFRYAFVADDCIHPCVKLCAVVTRESGNAEHHTTYYMEKLKNVCKDEFSNNDENDCIGIASGSNNNNNDDRVILCLQALRQVVFSSISSKSEEPYFDECEITDKCNSHTEDTSEDNSLLRIASVLMQSKNSTFRESNNNNLKLNEVDKTNGLFTVSYLLQSAVLCKLAAACTAYSVCNSSHHDNDNSDFNVSVSQHQVESAIQLVEFVCVEGEVKSIFGPSPSFAHTLHVLSVIYPLSTICMQWALSLISKLLQTTSQGENSNLLTWELKETVEDKNAIKITTPTKPSQVKFCTRASNFTSFSSSFPVKRALLLRELNILHETIERSTRQTFTVDCNDSNIVAQRQYALESIERAITHLEEELHHDAHHKTLTLLEEQQESCNTSKQCTFTCTAKKKSNENDIEDEEHIAQSEEVMTKSFVLEEWKPILNSLIWALDTHSNSTIAISLMELAHSLDRLILCKNVSEYITSEVQSYVCTELWPVLIRALFVCDDICVVTNAIRCLCWLAMHRFDSPTSTHVAHTLFTCLKSTQCSANLNKQAEVEITPLMRFLLSDAHLSRAEISNKAHVTRFKLRLLELILSLCDYDGDHRTLCNIDHVISNLSQHQSSLYKMLAAMCNAQEEVILQIAVLHLIGHVVVALYPRVSLRLVCQLCYDVFHHCPVAMARASCAAMLHTIVLSLQQPNLLSALQDDVDLSEVKVLAESMSCYNLNSHIAKTLHTTCTKKDNDNNNSNNNSSHTMQSNSPPPSEKVNNDNEESGNAQSQEHYEVIRNHGKAIIQLLENLLSYVLQAEKDERDSNNTTDKAFIATKRKVNILTNLSATSHLPQLLLSTNTKRNVQLNS